jgi:hypothetical protein
LRAILARAVEMEPNSFLDFAFDFLDRRSRCDAFGQVRYISRIVVVAFSITIVQRILLPSLELSLLKILFNVPGARSSDGLPGTVTVLAWSDA